MLSSNVLATLKRALPIRSPVHFMPERPRCALIHSTKADECRSWLAEHNIVSYDTWAVSLTYRYASKDNESIHFVDGSDDTDYGPVATLTRYIMFSFARIEDVVFFKLGHG